MNIQFVLVLSLGCTILWGCSPQPIIRDSSKLVVVPGRGITNLCEIGMTLKQLRAATRDVSTHGIYDGEWSWRRFTGSRHAIIRSLGAIAPIENDKKLAIICFHVIPKTDGTTVRGLSVTNPFRGKIGDKLSFNDGPVSRNEVESQFGTINQVITNNSDAISLANEGKAFLYKMPGGREIIYCTRQGITFELKSNIVASFTVSKARSTNR